MAEQFARLGVVIPAGEIAGERAFEVMEANWDIVTAFLDCSTSWRCVARADGGIRLAGFDFAAVQAVLAMTGRVAGDLFDGLRIMEAAAIDALADMAGDC